ncbi:MAG: hypothetical protein JXQ90_01740 [Cyclobacteriaceae bacterium]
MKTLILSLIVIICITSCQDDDPTPNENEQLTFTDSFDGTGALNGYVTNNESSLPSVSQKNGRYYAELTDNSNNKTLHFHGDQGRLDAIKAQFPFEFVAIEIGIGMIDDELTAPGSSGDPYNFAGVQVHALDLSEPTSSHVVVGHRGGVSFTIEGKNTVNGSSSVDDIGFNKVPEGRANIRIVGNEDRTLTVYWQRIDETEWNLYNDTGNLPGPLPVFENEVYIGLITYAYGDTNIPFVGTCEEISLDNYIKED